jgi:hypothetical protein
MLACSQFVHLRNIDYVGINGGYTVTDVPAYSFGTLLEALAAVGFALTLALLVIYEFRVTKS